MVLLVVSSPELITVACDCGKLLVGLTAARRTIGIPLEIPPRIPPCRFVRVRIRREPVVSSRSLTNVSLLSVPRSNAHPNPTPYSTPNTAGKLKRAFPKSAFNLSKTGSPSPAGTPVATTSATPPTEFCSPRSRSMRSTISVAATASGHLTMLGVPSGKRSTCSTLIDAGSVIRATTSPIWRT